MYGVDVLVLEPEGFGSNPDFIIYYSCNLWKSLLSLFEPQLPHLLIRDVDDDNDDNDDDNDDNDDDDDDRGVMKIKRANTCEEVNVFLAYSNHSINCAY